MKAQCLSLILILTALLLLVSCGKSGGPSDIGVSPSAGITASATPANASATPAASGASQANASEKPLTPEELEALRLKNLDPGTPAFSPAGGITKTAVKVVLTCPVREAKILYTLDGSEPKPGAAKEYSTPLNLETSTYLKVRSYVPQGRSSAVSEVDYTIGEVCVTVDGTGNGSRSKPLGSIKAGLDAAKTLGIGTVKLAAGKYDGGLVLQAPSTISGGWAKGFAKRSAERSVIQGATMPGNSKADPGFALKVTGQAANAELKLEHLEIRGGEATYATGLFVTDGAAPTLSACTLTGGDGSYGYGAFISKSANPTFNACQFDGGTSPSSYGISLDSAQANLYSSIVAAGSGTVIGDGANVTASKIVAYNTVFAGSAANTNHGAALYNSKGSVFEACTLWGGSGREAAALFVSEGNPIVSSCIIAADGKKKSYGIYANFSNSIPSILRNTAFSGCENALYFDAANQIAYTKLDESGKLTNTAGKILAAVVPQACISLALTLGPTPNYKTPADAPASLTTGGLASAASTLDAGGNRRSEPWTIGAWQVSH